VGAGRSRTGGSWARVQSAGDRGNRSPCGVAGGLGPDGGAMPLSKTNRERGGIARVLAKCEKLFGFARVEQAATDRSFERSSRKGGERALSSRDCRKGAIARRDSVTVSREPITAAGLETVSGMPSPSPLESHLCRNLHSACRGGEGRASRRYAVGSFSVGQSRWWLEGRDWVRLAGSWLAKFEVSEISTDIGEQLQARYIGISKGQAIGLGGG